MKQGGFSLVELVVIIGIIGILIAIGTLDYGNWSRKYNAEAQMKTMYADFASAKLDALHSKRQYQITLGSSQYVIRNYSSAFDATGTVTQTKTLKTPVTWSHDNIITFDTRGFTPLSSARTVCLASSGATTVDCVIVSQTRIDLGQKINPGGECASANCRPR
ncbi:prepilin-type N-terminal cleavage/methylation domain-containing protein [Geobacter sulfurreducens]|uniref:prepilin-type N-terminal cleavage/methylation domain-containing protein n=1 Tax=Geobacter sulfurreducens TaxID=35554 RepID=UPI002BEE2BC0|nr:prepilin-type N-terminal cleavage/methylation domain-containing protein [Geobacter sulfurreducens]HML77941.1 prepilin-type N-terminal cleavage/methylation domain-containing protein [Geobacter sulfurreducens]